MTYQRKPIPGYEGLYEVDTEGLVWRVGAPRKKPLAAAKTNNYLRVVLSKDAQHKNFCVHTLVLLAFEGPCPEGHQCRHLNGVSVDNRVSNLVYGTPKENQRDRFLHGTANVGEKAHQARLTEKQVRHIRRVGGSHLVKKILAKQYGVSEGTIYHAYTGRNWKYVKG